MFRSGLLGRRRVLVTVHAIVTTACLMLWQGTALAADPPLPADGTAQAPAAAGEGAAQGAAEAASEAVEAAEPAAEAVPDADTATEPPEVAAEAGAASEAVDAATDAASGQADAAQQSAEEATQAAASVPEPDQETEASTAGDATAADGDGQPDGASAASDPAEGAGDAPGEAVDQASAEVASSGEEGAAAALAATSGSGAAEDAPSDGEQAAVAPLGSAGSEDAIQPSVTAEVEQAAGATSELETAVGAVVDEVGSVDSVVTTTVEQPVATVEAVAADAPAPVLADEPVDTSDAADQLAAVLALPLETVEDSDVTALLQSGGVEDEVREVQEVSVQVLSEVDATAELAGAALEERQEAISTVEEGVRALAETASSTLAGAADALSGPVGALEEAVTQASAAVSDAIQETTSTPLLQEARAVLDATVDASVGVIGSAIEEGTEGAPSPTTTVEGGLLVLDGLVPSVEEAVSETTGAAESALGGVGTIEGTGSLAQMTSGSGVLSPVSTEVHTATALALSTATATETVDEAGAAAPEGASALREPLAFFTSAAPIPGDGERGMDLLLAGARGEEDDPSFPIGLVSLASGAEAEAELGAPQPDGDDRVGLTPSAAAFVRRELLRLTPSEAASLFGEAGPMAIDGDPLDWTPGWLPFTGFVLLLPLVGGALLLMSGGRVALWYGKHPTTV